MEKHLDFTIDFETCSLSANAAVMQVAVVPWLRDDDQDPFCNVHVVPYEGHVDLRTCVVDGFDFDPSTIKWWSERSDAAKYAVCKGNAEPIVQVLANFFSGIQDITGRLHLQSICLWCQGPDVDIAILRNLCRKYGVDLEKNIPHTSFRDCRTIILEGALVRADQLRMMKKTNIAAGVDVPSADVPEAWEIFANPSLAYGFYDPLPDKHAEDSEAHDALYDARRSSWLTWQALRWLNGK